MSYPVPTMPVRGGVYYYGKHEQIMGNKILATLTRLGPCTRRCVRRGSNPEGELLGVEGFEHAFDYLVWSEAVVKVGETRSTVKFPIYSVNTAKSELKIPNVATFGDIMATSE